MPQSPASLDETRAYLQDLTPGQRLDLADAIYGQMVFELGWNIEDVASKTALEKSQVESFFTMLYMKDVPNIEHADRIINAIKDATLEFERSVALEELPRKPIEPPKENEPSTKVVSISPAKHQRAPDYSAFSDALNVYINAHPEYHGDAVNMLANEIEADIDRVERQVIEARIEKILANELSAADKKTAATRKVMEAISALTNIEIKERPLTATEQYRENKKHTNSAAL